MKPLPVVLSSSLYDEEAPSGLEVTDGHPQILPTSLTLM